MSLLVLFAGFILIFLYLLLPVILVFILISSIYSDIKGAPFVPNNKNVIEHSLRMAKVGVGDVLADLGSGNGKVLFMAISEFRVKRAIGYEIAPWPYLLSVIKSSLKGYSKVKCKFYRKSMFKAELSSISVVYVYLLPGLLEKLVPQLKLAKKNNPHLRIVSPVFEIKGMTPIKKERVKHEGFRKEVYIYMY